MGMKIEREGNGYRIRLSGDRTKVIAKSVAEIHQAIAHYYADPLPHSMMDAKTHAVCPFCRTWRR